MAVAMLKSSCIRASLWLDSVAVSVPRLIDSLFSPPFPPPAPILDICEDVPLNSTNVRSQSWLEILIGDGFLLAVPKSRRTIQKRMNRKFGYPEFVWKPLVKRTNILQCTTCGHNKQADALCPNCYERIKLETNEIQEKIYEELKLKPIEKDVVVLYDGETLEHSKEFYQGKRIIEMKKTRPAWFTKNLLQKTTQQPSESTDVKPTELA